MSQDTEPIQAVQLVRDGPAPASSSFLDGLPPFPGPVIWIPGLVTVVVVAFLAVRLKHQRRDPNDTAWRRTARRLKLSREDQHRVRTLANALVGDSGRAALPAALLLSQDAFIRAAAAVRTESHPWATAEGLSRLHQKVFG